MLSHLRRGSGSFTLMLIHGLLATHKLWDNTAILPSIYPATGSATFPTT
jgi:hypothetical protein